jgi:hypothetical protein
LPNQRLSWWRLLSAKSMVLINVTSLNVKMSAYDAVDGSSTGI